MLGTTTWQNIFGACRDLQRSHTITRYHHLHAAASMDFHKMSDGPLFIVRVSSVGPAAIPYMNDIYCFNNHHRTIGAREIHEREKITGPGVRRRRRPRPVRPFVRVWKISKRTRHRPSLIKVRRKVPGRTFPMSSPVKLSGRKQATKHLEVFGIDGTTVLLMISPYRRTIVDNATSRYLFVSSPLSLVVTSRNVLASIVVRRISREDSHDFYLTCPWSI